MLVDQETRLTLCKRSCESKTSKIAVPDNTQELVNLYEKTIADKATAHDLVHLSFLRGMITVEQYADFLKIDKSCDEDEEDE